MKVFNFPIPTDQDVIIVNTSIEGKYKFRLALDTAATHTTIDSNVLYFSGYELKDSKGEQEIETSNGIILVELYDINQFECLGIVKPDFEVQVYDSIAHGITSDYDGVIGLNFLKEQKFCIDIMKGEVSVDIEPA
ncbi:MAG: aspartyl protease family protein [Ginsengibacter sp.]